MKTKFTLSLLAVFGLCSLICAQGSYTRWANRYGAPNVHDEGYAVTTDDAGNVYTTGSFKNTASFGSYTLTASGINIFVTKTDSLGNILWAKNFGTGTNTYGEGYAITSYSNSVYITGKNVSNSAFGSYTLSPGSFLLKTDTSGNVIWVKNIGSGEGRAVSTSTNGDVYVGYNDGSSANLKKYDAGGTNLWSKQFSSLTSVYGMDVNTSDDIFMTGNFNGSAVFGTYTVSAVGSVDGFVAKINPGGVVQWAKSMGSSSTYDEARSVAADNSGNAFVTGYFTGTAVIGTYTLTGVGLGTEVFLTKIDGSGNFVWANRFGGSNSNGDNGYGVATDQAGNVYATGFFHGPASFGSNTMNMFDCTFVVKCDPTGNVLWAQQFGSGGNGARSSGIASDAVGRIYVIGSFYGPCSFGQYPLASPGGKDAFIIRVCNSSTGCDSPSTGIHEKAFENDPDIYPNPFNNRLNIVSSNEGVNKVILTDLYGKTVYETETHTAESIISLDQLQAGIYFIQVISPSGQPVTRKIVKQ